MGELKRLFKEEEGVTAIEYAILAMLIAVVIVGAVRVVGTWLQNPFNDVNAAFR